MGREKARVLPAVLSIAGFAAAMIVCGVWYGASPHIPMLLGCVIAGALAILDGCTWDRVQEGMIEGVRQALGSVIILMLIGILIGVWIVSGVVPAMIYYGLQLFSPRFFLTSAMVICAVISMAVGSWGTAGTIGLALMGIAQALEVPAPMAAGAIISGAYLGDKISPLSDSTNLASAVTGVDIFRNVKRILPVALCCFAAAGVLYTAMGAVSGGGSSGTRNVEELSAAIRGSFRISPLGFLPLAVMVACILLKLPSMPGICAGIASAAVLGALMQGAQAGDILDCAYYGYQAASGNPVMDALLTAGGLDRMMHSVSMIICAMMYGGIMECSGFMEAIMRPVLGRIRSRAGLVGASVLTCMGVNCVLPEQYIAIALPGRMYAAAYDRQGVDRAELTRALGAGGASFSPLIPWNTCGVYMAGVLGVSAAAYARYAFLNLLMGPMVIVSSLLFRRRRAGREEALPQTP